MDKEREIRNISLSVQECIDMQSAIKSRLIDIATMAEDFNELYRLVSLYQRLDYFIHHDEKGNLIS